MAVRSAGGLEAGVGRAQRVTERPGACDHEPLVGAPASGREALRENEVEAVASRAQVLFVCIHQICLERRAERVHMTVRVATCQYVLASGQRVEVVAVEQKAP